ncbi:hypothetical protein [Desulfobacter curvatus]|uniref:hypothetical protein n=1 Tax=Desulfobacter curvatus TaxID=2290 RepID=UPI0012F84E97|nr:hypothetical protein [Desulfobacter curvatus]
MPKSSMWWWRWIVPKPSMWRRTMSELAMWRWTVPESSILVRRIVPKSFMPRRWVRRANGWENQTNQNYDDKVD